jgi:predicted ATPase
MLATEQGFPLQASRGAVVYAWAVVMSGQPKAGIAKLHQALDDYHATGGQVLRPYVLALIAEAYGEDGEPAVGVKAMSEALSDMLTIGMHFYEAELYRLKGDLLLKQAISDVAQAETCFHEALDVARRQGAKSWELRAVTSLARLWQHQGRRQDAYDVLAPVYEWFTEGFDTADLQEARALLDGLGEYQQNP